MAKPRTEIQKVPNGYRAVIYVEYPIGSCYTRSAESVVTDTKRVDLAKSDPVPTKEMAEATLPYLFVAFDIRQ